MYMGINLSVVRMTLKDSKQIFEQVWGTVPVPPVMAIRPQPPNLSSSVFTSTLHSHSEHSNRLIPTQ